MFPSRALVPLILAGVAFVNASALTRSTGKTTLSLATRINTVGTLNIVERDHARAQAIINNVKSNNSSSSVSVANSGITYTAQVGVGSPPTYYTLIVDTGSSNTWVGANKPYVPTNTSYDTGNAIVVEYGSGSVEGVEWLDTVTLGSGLVTVNQSIGVASSAVGSFGYDGILGVGPLDLTTDTVGNTSTVPTVMDNLFSQGRISEEVLGVYFVPVSESHSNGTLTFGGYDESVITSSVKYVPLSTTYPALRYWGIDLALYYGNVPLMWWAAGVVDTGTTLILIATDAFQIYQSQTGSVLDPVTGLLAITSNQYSKLKPLRFNIGGTNYNLSPNAQIWPRSLNSAIGGNSSFVYLVVSNLGILSGTGIDFINGYTFMERFYTVFDTENKRVGFATTHYTRATPN